MERNSLVIGSRGSRLALTQAGIARDSLLAAYPELNIEIKAIKTTGDKILGAPLNKRSNLRFVGDKGLFTKEIEDALLENKIDLAVHSMKDLPVDLPGGLKIAAVTKRENACDVLVTPDGLGGLDDLPKGAKVGTSSLRRRAQLLNKRDDLEVLDLRGNLDTRIKKLEEGLYDAIILAYAGVKRLNLQLKMSQIKTSDILPQAGQGALGIEIREFDSSTEGKVKMLDDCETRVCISAERALLAVLGGGCQVPIGVEAWITNDELKIRAGVFSLDGKKAVRGEISGRRKEADSLGGNLADILLKKGAKGILAEVYNG